MINSDQDFYKIADVAARWGISVDAVLHQADCGKLVLSVSLIQRGIEIRRSRAEGYNGTLMPEFPGIFDLPLWTARAIARTGSAVADELSCRDGKVMVEVCDLLHLTVDNLYVTSKEIARIEASIPQTSDQENTVSSEVLDVTGGSIGGGGEVTRSHEKETLHGVDRNKILASFPPPKGVTPEQWSKRLGEPSNGMLAARVFSGGKGVSALWNPAKFAMWCADKCFMTKENLTVIICRDFNKYLPEWKTYTDSFK